MITTATIEGLEAGEEIARLVLAEEIPVDLVQHQKGDCRVVTLHVEEEDEDRVQAILKENEGKLKGLIHCPSCQSTMVEFPGRPRRSPSAAVVEALAEKLHIREPGFFCRSCQHSWH